MRRPPAWKSFALFLLGLCWLASSAAADKLPEPIAAALKHQGMSARGLSLYVHEIGQPEPLLAIAADAPRHPASTIKVLTTLVALEELSPAWHWKTEAYVTAPVRDGQLDGDLFIKGYGDPYLVIEHFWRFLRTLRAYNVLPNALLVNFQAVNFRFMPQPQADRMRIFADPLPANLEVENRVRLTRGPCRGWAHNLGMKVQQRKAQTRVIFSGSYDADCGDNELFRVVSEPAPYILGMFRALWTELGGRFEGEVREATVPAGARLLATVNSPPLADIVRSINKYSNNVMARQLLLTLGAERSGAPGTTDKGIQVVHEWLQKRRLDFPELVLENGAGLSREEAISARHLGEVLLTAWRSPFMPEFVSSLPISAMDGTLRKRFNEDGLEGQMHLKTGSLRDVRSVAGYVQDRAGRRVVVVCLHNSSRADTVAGQAVQEAVLRWAYERP